MGLKVCDLSSNILPVFWKKQRNAELFLTERTDFCNGFLIKSTMAVRMACDITDTASLP